MIYVKVITNHQTFLLKPIRHSREGGSPYQVSMSINQCQMDTRLRGYDF